MLLSKQILLLPRCRSPVLSKRDLNPLFPDSELDTDLPLILFLQNILVCNRQNHCNLQVVFYCLWRDTCCNCYQVHHNYYCHRTGSHCQNLICHINLSSCMTWTMIAVTNNKHFLYTRTFNPSKQCYSHKATMGVYEQ
jgi:hypothetical protein